MQATRLLQHNNPSQNQLQTLQVLKSNKATQLLLINKFHSHLQEIKNTPNMNLNYLIMQATHFLQHNNPPQNQFPTSQVYIKFYKFLTRIYLLCSN